MASTTPNANFQTFKIVLLGAMGTGKTHSETFISQLSEVGITCNVIRSSAVFFSKSVTNKAGKKVVLQIWDTAGQERFQSLAPMYYRNAEGAIVTFDLGDAESFNRARLWIAELKARASVDCSIVLAGTKCDMEARSKIQALQDEYGLEYFETSSKTSHNVKEVFDSLVEGLKTAPRAKSTVDVADRPPAKKKCCFR